MMNPKASANSAQGLLLPTVAVGAVVLFGVISISQRELLFSFVISVLALLVAFIMGSHLLQKSTGSKAMMDVADAIREGSNGFFQTQYTAIAAIACLTAAGLFFVFSMRGAEGDAMLDHAAGFIVTGAFLSGAVCSCAAGYIGLWMSVRTNVRVAAAARTSYIDPIKVALAGGTVAAIVVVALVVLGITVLYLILELLFVGKDNLIQSSTEVPILMVGFGFGASFVAMFAQLGGGIFTKAADVGADLVGKVEAGIPEDDPRNPAVIADLVGDNVGDCAGRGADLFESIAAEIIAAMILGGTLCNNTNIADADRQGFILFPLVVHAFDLIVSVAGVLVILVTHNGQGDETVFGDPLTVLKKGYFVAGLLAVGAFALSCKLLLSPAIAPGAWWYFFLCGLFGMVTGWVTVLITQYYTDKEFRPVRSIAAASKTGHATNIIAGLSVGFESTAAPTVVVSIAILASFWLGNSSGLKLADGTPTGGLFGTAVATMGMLSTAVYVLSMDFFGPIADNAGGIVEMSDEPESVRKITDMLDAVGNTTKAATKGFAIGSAALACFLLFTAYIDEIEVYSGRHMDGIDISRPEIFVAGLLGAMLVFLFTAFTISAVGTAAQGVVEEVRRQFQEFPGIMSGEQKPQYNKCVAYVTQEALRLMIRPGLLALCYPLVIGVIFRQLGDYMGDPLLGAKAVLSMLITATITGILMSLFLNNAGGAWDNAKKLIETGTMGGKGSETHKAAVTGDTVGDPCKDTAGPSLHVLIKLLATVTLVFAPLFVSKLVPGASDHGVGGRKVDF